MDDNKDINLDKNEDKDNVSNLTNETNDSDKTLAANSSQSDTATSKKTKKNKEPMPKKKKLIAITACSIVGVIILSLFIWLMVFLFGPGATQDLSNIPIKVDMGNKYYIGTQGQIDYSKIFPNGSDFNLDGEKFTFKQDGKVITKEVETIDGAINVNTFDELVSNINSGNKVVIQNANLKAPSLEGKKEDEIPVMKVTNDVYGNGAVVNVNEIVASRFKYADKNGGKLAAKIDGLSYKKGTHTIGYDAFTIVPRPDNAQVIFQDVHITGNDMSTAEGGDIAGKTDKEIAERGVKLLSGYGSLLYICGDDQAKANALVKHCVIENAGKVVHIFNSNVDIEGTFVRNASDTTISIATAANRKSIINMKNNVIANSLTGGILFYCMDTTITKANEDASWNELNIDGFLDIYNWKKEKGLAFLPETEGAMLANIANDIANTEITNAEYDALKAKEMGEKYIHFAIIKIRTGGNDLEVQYNGSKVNGYDKIGYTDSKENNIEGGFPIPKVAKFIMKEIDVWGYYGNEKAAIGPTDGISEKVLETLYVELREGRKS